MRRHTSIFVFLIAILSNSISAFAQSSLEPPPAPPRATSATTPTALGGVQHLTPRPMGFGDNGESGTYSYDGSGNIIAIGSDTFLYDAEGRLVTAVVRNVQGTYTYDAFGNRKTATGETNCLGQSVCASPLTVSPSTNHLLTTTANSATTSVTYDDAGNISTASGGVYAYDGTGMMTRATVGTDDRQFVYTADDERIAVRQGQSWMWTVRGLDNKVLREFTSGEPNQSPGLPTPGGQWVKDYIWRDGLLLASTDASGTYHYHLDHLGTPRLITNMSHTKVAEHAYYPFGAEIYITPHESIEEAMKFTGHERDLVAGDGHTLDDMHARYYNASLGRFLSRDPELNGEYASHEPQAWNRYSYALNSPIDRIDPDGRADKVPQLDNIQLVLTDTNDHSGVFTPQQRMDQVAARARAGDPTAKAIMADNKGAEAGALGPLDVVVFGGSLRAAKVAQPVFRFASEEVLREHFEKHGAEFGFQTAAQYLRAAVRFVANSGERGTVSFTRANGDRIIYRIATNEFAVATRANIIRTYFSPTSGAAYYAGQLYRTMSQVLSGLP